MDQERARKGLTVDVYRPAHGVDCTLGGVSSKHTRLTVIGMIDERGGRQPGAVRNSRTVTALTGTLAPHAAHAGAPAVYLLIREVMGATVYCVVPADDNGDPPTRWYMSGGNMAATSDSRWRELVDGWHGAISVHDRYEH